VGPRNVRDNQKGSGGTVSFLLGKNVQQPNVNQATSGLDQALINYIQGQGFSGLNPPTQVDAASIAPYQKLFADQNAQTFGQAKESAGNLTGSGLAAGLGTAAQRASTEQGSFLANLFENRRQQDAARFLQLVLGTLGSPAGGVTNVHQPGLLEYAAQGASAAAPFFAGGAGGAGAVAAAAPLAAAQQGQLGQAARYNFDGTHAYNPDPGTNSYFKGFTQYRDSFGTPRGY